MKFEGWTYLFSVRTSSGQRFIFLNIFLTNVMFATLFIGSLVIKQDLLIGNIKIYNKNKINQSHFIFYSTKLFKIQKL